MPTESRYSPVPIPEDDLFGFLFERKQKPYPDNHVIFTDAETKSSYSYAQTRDGAVAFGRGLRSKWQWKQSETLVIFSPNSIDYAIVMWGAIWAGAVVSTANPSYTADELAFQLKDSGAKAIVTQPAMANVAIQAAETAGIPSDRVIVMGVKNNKGSHVHFTDITAPPNTKMERIKVDPEKIVFLPYSSGTTGRPKGVMLCHRNLTSQILQVEVAESGFDWQKDKVAAILPFFHIYGLVLMVHQCFYRGIPLHVMAKFDLAKFCELIQTEKITFSYIAPPVLVLLGKSPIVSKYDLSSLKMLGSGAAPLTKELVMDVYQRLKVPTKQAYGLSETSPGIHVQPPNRWECSIGSVGILMPNISARFVDDAEKDVPEGEPGELWVKGPNVFLGYLNNEAGTKNALTPDGWFKTGDIGYQDKDGNFYITDRLKELIKYKGYQVPPAELEGVLLAHPHVADVAVIGVEDKAAATEVPRAYVVLAEGVDQNEKTLQDIAQWMTSKVAPHKRLRGGVRRIDEIPKTASGKILRRNLKSLIAAEDKKTQSKL